MDQFHRCGVKEIGIGGMHCHCCGPKPSNRKWLRRRSRRRLRHLDRTGRLRVSVDNSDPSLMY